MRSPRLLVVRCRVLTHRTRQIRVMRNAETGLGKGFAFVRYVSADAAAVRSCKAPHVCSFARVLMPHRRAQAAVEHLNGLEVCGRAVGVVRSQAHTQLFVGGYVSAGIIRFTVLS